jgi:hypothetical protein
MHHRLIPTGAVSAEAPAAGLAKAVRRTGLLAVLAVVAATLLASTFAGSASAATVKRFIEPLEGSSLTTSTTSHGRSTTSGATTSTWSISSSGP